MKLGGLHDGRLTVSAGRGILVETADGHFERVGELPVPVRGRAGLSYRLKTGRARSLLARYVGRFASVNVWPVSATTVVASADRWLFVSRDGGRTWETSLILPSSSGPMGILPSGFCVTDDAWYLGEYPLDTAETPRVRRSTDAGRTWSTVCSLPDVRHVHSVQADPYTGAIWLTTGDSGAGCGIGRLHDGTFQRLGSGDQRWRAVELAFTPEGVLWGMDSVYEREKPIFAVDRTAFDTDDPDPRRVHTLDSSVYYATTVETDDAHWAVFTTAMEPGTDSTAPGGSQASFSARARVVAASSATEYTEWLELAAFQKRPAPADTLDMGGTIPSANAYVFLDSDPDRGLVLNPYNTAQFDGELLRVTPAMLAESSPDDPVEPAVTHR